MESSFCCGTWPVKNNKSDKQTVLDGWPCACQDETIAWLTEPSGRPLMKFVSKSMGEGKTAYECGALRHFIQQGICSFIRLLTKDLTIGLIPCVFCFQWLRYTSKVAMCCLFWRPKHVIYNDRADWYHLEIDSFFEVLPSKMQNSHSLISWLGAKPGVDLKLLFRFITPLVELFANKHSEKGERGQFIVLLKPFGKCVLGHIYSHLVS